VKFAAIVVLAGVCTAASVNRDAFLRAVQSGDGNAAAAMIQQGADVNAREANGTSALHWAVYHRDVALVKRLLAAGAKVAVVNDFGSSPMQEAAITGNKAVIKLLLDAGANVESANAEGQTALMAVARTGNVDAAKMHQDRVVASDRDAS